MAKRKINKSEAIRNYLNSNPGATPKTIIHDLKAKGVVVGASLVSQIKYKQPGNGRRKKGRRIAASANGHRVDFEQLVEARNLAAKLGGVAKAQEALNLLAKLT